MSFLVTLEIKWKCVSAVLLTMTLRYNIKNGAISIHKQPPNYPAATAKKWNPAQF